MLEIQGFTQLFHAFDVFLPAQGRHYLLGQGGDIGGGQGFAVHHPCTNTLIVTFKDREGVFFGAAGQKEPVAGAAGMVNRGVAPAVSRLGAGGLAGLNVSAVGIGQAKLGQVALAGADHTVEGGQVLGFLDHLFGAAQNRLGAELAEGVEPQALGLVEQLHLAEGTVILVVVIDAKQGKHLVDGVDQFGTGRGLRLLCFSLPSCGR